MQQNKITTIRIWWDSWDWIQIIWETLAKTIAIWGNNISTVPDFPAEIRAPIWTLEWVSTFEISFWDKEIIPPSSSARIIVLFNPAALKLNEKYINSQSILIVNTHSFMQDNLLKVGYKTNPLETWEIKYEKLITIDIEAELSKSLDRIDLAEMIKNKSKNFFILWIILNLLWLDRNYTKSFLEKKFSSNPALISLNNQALDSWYEYFQNSYEEKIIIKWNSTIKKWKYKILNWNEIIAYSLISWAKNHQRKLYFSGYPITPASVIMQTLAKYRQEDIIVMQSEDEIAAISWAIWWSYAWAIWVTATSWPWLSLKSEALNLAVMAELPLIVIDVQRAWPSTWLPTKTEQSDLMQAIFGRHWESPIVVMAIDSNDNAFSLTEKAINIAVKYMTPVIILSDSYLANNSSLFEVSNISWNAFERKKLPDLESFSPYLREKETLSRPWVIPWISQYEHRIWWLEKDAKTWAISYNWDNHELISKTRKEKIEKVVNDIPATKVYGQEKWDILVISWWSTFTSSINAVEELNNEWFSVWAINLTFLNPLPADIWWIISNYKKLLVAEENLWQLSYIIESRFKIQTEKLNKMKWNKIFPEDIISKIKELTK